ncbi:basic salivary proline-rich protein 3-like [Penaeus monodon]|uniref:basic salivary proline-rich protein 3-like n=1 Tax=Penaeus monodon TaxID=6687 RepID=UPI0018A76164|nr:basic salivary proline-rich protein 3-like [Penaeus monodon]
MFDILGYLLIGRETRSARAYDAPGGEPMGDPLWTVTKGSKAETQGTGETARVLLHRAKKTGARPGKTRSWPRKGPTPKTPGDEQGPRARPTGTDSWSDNPENGTRTKEGENSGPSPRRKHGSTNGPQQAPKVLNWLGPGDPKPRGPPSKCTRAATSDPRTRRRQHAAKARGGDPKPGCPHDLARSAGPYQPTRGKRGVQGAQPASSRRTGKKGDIPHPHTAPGPVEAAQAKTGRNPRAPGSPKRPQAPSQTPGGSM